MDYSKIHIAKKVLERADVAVPESEDEIREEAYKQLLKMSPGDFLAAHSIRLEKDFRAFTKEEWQEVIRISGITAVSDNMAAYAFCLKHGLI